MRALPVFKILFVSGALLGFIACSNKDGAGNTSTPGQILGGTTKTQGGVGVGNIAGVAAVPQTSASMMYPNTWTAVASGDVLSLKNDSGSIIEARKSEISDLSSPSSVSLQQYLKNKFPNRNYKTVTINGLQGVRADIVDTAANKQSDLYLVSELKDFVHIQSRLSKDGDGITEGDEIILTVKVAYRGIPVPDSNPKTVELPNYSGADPIRLKAAYSFKNDCYSYVDSNCRGVSILYGNGSSHEVSVGAAGYDHGRIVELGTESEIPFDSIKIDGKYIVAPLTHISIADIYSAFDPKDQHVELDRIPLRQGYVYLVRTVRWPEEDLITKFKVEKIDSGSVTITYQKLVYVLPEDLQKQVDLINKNTLENEMPMAEGQVTLYNNTVWNNYYFASFNFQYSTSGNMFLTHNSWDLMFSDNGEGKPSFEVPVTGSALGQVVDLGTKDIDSVSEADLPDPNEYKADKRPVGIIGHTYLVYHYAYAVTPEPEFIFGAVQVLNIGPKNEWVQLKFRRIKLGEANYFQKWITLDVPPGIQTVKLEKSTNNETLRFYPFINKRGDQGSHYYESLDLMTNWGTYDGLYVDSRPYLNKRGLFKLGQNISLDSVRVEDIEALKGQFTSSLKFQKGDVIALLLENYFDKTVMVAKVEDTAANQSVTLAIKYLLRQKTKYSDDGN